MGERARQLACAACLLGAALWLAGCGGSLSEGNYQRIEQGMALEEVRRLLGPGVRQVAAVPGRRAEESPDPPSRRSVYMWNDGSRRVVVTFHEGQVVSKYKQGF